MPADWREVRIAAGAQESDEVPIPLGSVSCPPGKMTKADGSKFQGRDRPRYYVEESGAGSKIVLDRPAPEDLVFRVKADDDD